MIKRIELYTNGVYEIEGHIITENGEDWVVGICTKSVYPQVKRVGDNVKWPVIHPGTKRQQFKTIRQLRNEKIDSILN